MKEYNNFYIGNEKYIFGRGAASCAGEELASNGRKKVLVVTDGFLLQSGLLDSVMDSLRKNDLAYEIFSEVEPDPSSETVEKALAVFRNTGCDSVIAVGGGSVIDTGKGVRLMADNPGSILEYDNITKNARKIRNHGEFFIAVPTTSGTGSEVTPYAIITNKKENRKATITTQYNAPDIALVDPELTMELPAGLTASTGMDALCHAIGAYTSGRVIGAGGSTAFTDTIALKAIELTGSNLRTAVNCGNVYEARKNMMMASSLGALASPAGGDASHGIGHPLGAYYHIPHGIACAVALPYILDYNCVTAPDRYAKIAVALGSNVEGMSVMEAAHSAGKAVQSLMDDIGIPDLEKYIKDTQTQTFEDMITAVTKEKCSIINPRPVTEDTARTLIMKALHKERL